MVGAIRSSLNQTGTGCFLPFVEGPFLLALGAKPKAGSALRTKEVRDLTLRMTLGTALGGVRAAPGWGLVDPAAHVRPGRTSLRGGFGTRVRDW